MRIPSFRKRTAPGERQRSGPALAALCCTALACQASAQAAGPGAGPAPAEPEPTYLVVYRAGARWPAGEAQPEPLRDHFRYLLALHRRGALKLAGPFGSEPGGAAVFTAADDAAAQALLEADPAVAAQLFEVELRRWSLVDWAGHAAAQSR